MPICRPEEFREKYIFGQCLGKFGGNGIFGHCLAKFGGNSIFGQGLGKFGGNSIFGQSLGKFGEKHFWRKPGNTFSSSGISSGNTSSGM